MLHYLFNMIVAVQLNIKFCINSNECSAAYVHTMRWR